MKVTICDPNTFESKDVEIDDLQHDIASRVLQALPEVLKDLTPEVTDNVPSLTFTKLICKEDGQVVMGIIFREGVGESGTKKYRVTIEKMEQ